MNDRIIDKIILEVRIENGSRIDELIAKKADRVELNDNMAVGGTTVSYGVAENAIQRFHAGEIRVMSMIRPRGGNFVYNDDEISIMLKDIEILHKLETDGVVFGCLTPSGSLDREKMHVLIQAATARKLEIVFHMAFDHINYDEQLESLHWLANKGVTRILTHGSANQSDPIQNNYKRLKEYVSAGRIEILPGGGVTKDNYREVCTALNIQQAHGSKIL